MKKGQIIKVAATIFACVLLDIILHIVTSSYSTMPENPNYSLVQRILGTEITVSLWAIIAFSGVAFVFWKIRNEIPGVGVKKGLRYGAAIALLWMFAMLEGVSLFGNPIMKEFVVGLSDAIPVFVMCILLSKLQIGEAMHDRPVTFVFKQKIKAVLIFTGMFLAGRYIAYLSGIIKSGNQSRPFHTLIWTLLMGISIGSAFIMLGNSKNERSFLHRAVRFGFLIFGLNWTVFLVFMPLLFSGYIGDVFLRILIDTILATIASYLTIIPKGEFLRKQNLQKHEAA
ncbi:MAG TPA: hypothetical protein PK629_00710 [Oscillospiraceae bacterium]|nr:hypothetical protein [Oscillospiraceae bacterium]HPK34536.1 hypothetical protein [Oscillospiraceae bacterium]HPR74764.1 hypothetical protein [Oscillospiraceae bacterium]